MNYYVKFKATYAFSDEPFKRIMHLSMGIDLLIFGLVQITDVLGFLCTNTLPLYIPKA